MIDFFRLPSLRRNQQRFIRDLLIIVGKLKAEYPKDPVVITGHSLGGNFAELAGAKLNIPAVGFSAPGQFIMMKPFNITRQAISQNVMTIIPSMDPVPHVAKHVDVVQRILCRKKSGQYRPSSDCHSIEATGCELWRVCGDIQKRDFSQKCLEKQPDGSEAFVNKSCVGQIFAESKEAKCRLVADR